MGVNAVNLIQTDGGQRIKQGDFSSVFTFLLADENGSVISGLNGDNAVITLSRKGRVRWRKVVEVTDDSVSFTLDDVLEVGIYTLEVTASRYVFPSDNTLEIQVVKSGGEYSPRPLGSDSLTNPATLDLVKQLVGKVSGVDGLITLDEVKTLLEDKLEGFTPSDSLTRGQVLELISEQLATLPKTEPLTNEQIESIIEHSLMSLTLPKGEKGDTGETGLQGERGEQGIQGEKGETGERGADGKSAYEIALANGFIGSETAWLASLKGADGRDGRDGQTVTVAGTGAVPTSAVRRAPMMWTLDRSIAKDWHVWFDNGCGIHDKTMSGAGQVWGYGQTAGAITEAKLSETMLPRTIIQCSIGVVTIAMWKKATEGVFNYWRDTLSVVNPINDSSEFDFSNAKFVDGNTPLYHRQKNVIRIMYELGVWTESDIISLGAVKRSMSV